MKALDFIREVARDGDLVGDLLHLANIRIDWPDQVVTATVSTDLNLVFDLVSNHLRVSDVSFG